MGRNCATRCTLGWFKIDSGSDIPASLSRYEPTAAMTRPATVESRRVPILDALCALRLGRRPATSATLAAAITGMPGGVRGTSASATAAPPSAATRFWASQRGPEQG